MNESSVLDTNTSDYSSEHIYSSELSESDIGNSSVTSDYISEIIYNQNQILYNQHISNDYLGTMLFLLILAIGIYLAYLFGKFIHNLIN